MLTHDSPSREDSGSVNTKTSVTSTKVRTTTSTATTGNSVATSHRCVYRGGQLPCKSARWRNITVTSGGSMRPRKGIVVVSSSSSSSIGGMNASRLPPPPHLMLPNKRLLGPFGSTMLAAGKNTRQATPKPPRAGAMATITAAEKMSSTPLVPPSSSEQHQCLQTKESSPAQHRLAKTRTGPPISARNKLSTQQRSSSANASETSATGWSSRNTMKPFARGLWKTPGSSAPTTDLQPLLPRARQVVALTRARCCHQHYQHRRHHHR